MTMTRARFNKIWNEVVLSGKKTSPPQGGQPNQASVGLIHDILPKELADAYADASLTPYQFEMALGAASKKSPLVKIPFKEKNAEVYWNAAKQMFSFEYRAEPDSTPKYAVGDLVYMGFHATATPTSFRCPTPFSLGLEQALSAPLVEENITLLLAVAGRLAAGDIRTSILEHARRLVPLHPTPMQHGQLMGAIDRLEEGKTGDVDNRDISLTPSDETNVRCGRFVILEQGRQGAFASVNLPQSSGVEVTFFIKKIHYGEELELDTPLLVQSIRENKTGAMNLEAVRQNWATYANTFNLTNSTRQLIANTLAE